MGGRFRHVLQGLRKPSSTIKHTDDVRQDSAEVHDIVHLRDNDWDSPNSSLRRCCKRLGCGRGKERIANSKESAGGSEDPDCRPVHSKG
jgi:hypothetical protein